VRVGNLWRFVNAARKQVVTCKYRNVNLFDFEKAQVSADKETFFINRDGKKVD
jgi:hypothetical protein